MRGLLVMLLLLLLAVCTVSSFVLSPTADDVDIHVVTDYGRPTTTLYAITEHDRAVEYPEPNTFVLSFGDPLRPRQTRDYYVGHYLLPTDMSLGSTSSLWLWWDGFLLDARILTLQNDAKIDAAFDSVAHCAAHTDTYTCSFAASATISVTEDEPLAAGMYNVTCCTSEDSSVLPPSLFRDEEDTTLHLFWSDGAVYVEGPFVLGEQANTIVLSHKLRHHYAMKYEHAKELLSFRKRDDMIDIHRPLVDFALTMAMLYTITLLLSAWTLDRMHDVLALPLVALPFLYVGSSFRLVILLYIAVRTIVGYVKPTFNVAVAYPALETLWTVSMLLHEKQPNMTSCFIKSLLTSVALRDLQRVMTSKRCLGALDIVDSTLALLLSANFVTDDAVPMISLEFGSRYGLVGLLPSLALLALLVEISMHLR